MELQQHIEDSYIDALELDRISKVLDIPMGNSVNTFLQRVIDYIETGVRVAGKIKKMYTGDYTPSKLGIVSMRCIGAMNKPQVMDLFLARLRRGIDPSTPTTYSYCNISTREGIITLPYERNSHAEQANSMIMSIISNGADYPTIIEAQRMIDRSVAHNSVKILMSSILLTWREENLLGL